jgi:hypothetical protein
MPAGAVPASRAPTMKPQPDRHNRHRFLPEIISHAVWLHLRSTSADAILSCFGLIVSLS